MTTPTTRIFPSFLMFLHRKDTSLNGISPEFYRQSFNCLLKPQERKGYWNEQTSVCIGRYLKRSKGEIIYDSTCNRISFLDSFGNAYEIPKLDKLHNMLSDTVSDDTKLSLHCHHGGNDTHSKAGWIIKLTGDSGEILEALTDTTFAAKLICMQSSPVSVDQLHIYPDPLVILGSIRTENLTSQCLRPRWKI